MNNISKIVDNEEVRYKLNYILYNFPKYDETGRIRIGSRAKYKFADKIRRIMESKYGIERTRSYLSFESNDLIDWNKPVTKNATDLSVFTDTIDDNDIFASKALPKIDRNDHSKSKKKKKKKGRKHKHTKKHKKSKSSFDLSEAAPKEYKQHTAYRKALSEKKNEAFRDRNDKIEAILPHILETEIPVKVSGSDVLFYDNRYGYWKNMAKAEVETHLMDLLEKGEKLKISHRDIKGANELLLNMSQLQDTFDEDNTYLVNCENGVLDIKNGELSKHSMNYKFTRVINAKYDPGAKGNVFMAFIRDACKDDEELILLVQEALGYAFSFSSKIKSAIMFYGPHDTGKSCILRLITDICGSDNISNVNIQDYGNPIFAAQMRNKAINIAPDLPSNPLTDISGFKSAVSGQDSIETRELYKNPVSTPCTAKHYFGANQFIKLKNLDEQNLDAYFSRLVVIPFLNQKDESEKDHDLNDKLRDERDFIFTWAMEGLMRLCANNWVFSRAEISDEVLTEYRCKYSPEAIFFDKYIVEDPESVISSEEVQKRFKDFADENGLQSGVHNMKKYINNVCSNVKKSRKRLDSKNPIAVYEGLAFRDDIE